MSDLVSFPDPCALSKWGGAENLSRSDHGLCMSVTDWLSTLWNLCHDLVEDWMNRPLLTIVTIPNLTLMHILWNMQKMYNIYHSKQEVRDRLSWAPTSGSSRPGAPPSTSSGRWSTGACPSPQSQGGATCAQKRIHISCEYAEYAEYAVFYMQIGWSSQRLGPQCLW